MALITPTVTPEQAIIKGGGGKSAPKEVTPDTSVNGTDDYLNMFSDMLKQIGDSYNTDLRGSPFRATVNARDKSSNSSPTKNSFPINSYYWYTSDLSKIFVYDYYNKISNVIQDYKAPPSPGKGLSGMLSSAVDTIVDNVKSYVDTISNDIKNIAESLGIKNKTVQKTITTDFNTYLKSFPQIRVYEIKVNDNLTVMTNILTRGISFLSRATSAGGFTDTAKTIISNLVKNLKAFMQEAFGTSDITKLYTPQNRIKLAIILYRRLISGIYTAYYEIPYINEESKKYLISNGQKGWTSSTLMGGEMSKNPILKTLTDTLNNFVEGIDIASKPKWSASGIESYPSIRTKFVLFNDTYEHFEKNLKFVHCFVSGNLWVQDVLIQRSSCLYDIEIPGRIRINLCAAKIEVKYLGKVRMNNKIVDTSDKMVSTEDVASGALNTPTIRPMDIKNTDLLRYIPDAFEVEIEFHSLLPNNFNSYMSYVAFNDVTPSVGDSVESIIEKIADNLLATDENNISPAEEAYNRELDEAEAQSLAESEQAIAIGEEGPRL